MFVKVFIDTNASAIDSIYDYKIPEQYGDYLKVGMRVVVPFGGANRKYQAIAVEITQTSQYDINKVKYIISVLDIEPVVPKYLIETAVFLRDNYFCNYSEAIRTVLPDIDKIRRISVYEVNELNLNLRETLSETQVKIFETLLKKPLCDFSMIKLKTGIDADILRSDLSIMLSREIILSDEIFTEEYHQKEDVYICLTPFNEELSETLNAVSLRATKQREVIKYLYEKGGKVLRSELYSATAANSATLTPLSERGLISIITKPMEYSDTDELIERPNSPLNEDQQNALKKYDEAKALGADKFLLFGVTSAGKTRVFFEMFDRVLKEGKQCLLLVPEIALTPQMTELVKRRFNANVAVMHSKLNYSERYAEFLKIKHNKAQIVLGARSAVFMPFKQLGIIVVDEEHESSYKSSQSPRYDTIEVASFIAKKTNAVLVLSSATPSVETYYRAMNGEYEVLRLPKRVNDMPMPYVSIIDMRKELQSGNRTPISNLLKDKIELALANNEQTLLFLNRRGYNTYVFCRKCGYIQKCPNCEVSLTYHKNSGKMVCHYCGHTENVLHVCPSCHSDKIKFMGTGTEKIEQSVIEMFPAARVLRLDSDVARNRNAYNNVLNSFANHEADILIGTQMIVKGLDFSFVTLTGILLADASLNFPDINAAARTYQLTSQAAGRSGRRSTPGQVVIQTYTPDNPTLVFSATHDYEGFYMYDIAHRKNLSYPPYTKIIGIFTASEDEQAALADSYKIYERLKVLIYDGKYDKIKQYEPSPAFIQKLKNKYIYHTLVRLPSQSDFLTILRDKYSDIRKNIKSTVFVEINPITLL